jgi:soluble lytic murein transglycosylase-like protein
MNVLWKKSALGAVLRGARQAVTVMVTSFVVLGAVPDSFAPAGADLPVASVSSAALVPPVAAAPKAAEPANPLDKLFDLVSSCGPDLSEQESWRIAGALRDESARYGYDPLFVLAMMQVESGCSPTARGPRGAVGLFQLLPSTARAMARACNLPWRGESTLMQPVVNLRLGLHYLWRLEQRYKDKVLALAAYNLGPGRVDQLGPRRARSARYVRRIVSRYESLRADLRLGRT